MNIDSKKPKTEIVAEEITEFIIDKNIKVGQKIPNEYYLANALGVGRSTVREAVRILISKNILYIKRGDGTYVSEKQGVLEDPLGLSLIEDKEKLLKDMLDIRFLIEPYIASQAALKANDEDKKIIEKLCDDVEVLIINNENHLDTDVKLHKAIADICGNTVMPKLIPVINQSIYLFGNVTNMMLKDATIQTHRELVEAIKRNDSKSAYDVMYLHLVYNRQAISKLFYKNE